MLNKTMQMIDMALTNNSCGVCVNIVNGGLGLYKSWGWGLH